MEKSSFLFAGAIAAWVAWRLLPWETESEARSDSDSSESSNPLLSSPPPKSIVKYQRLPHKFLEHRSSNPHLNEVFEGLSSHLDVDDRPVIVGIAGGSGSGMY